MPIEIWAVMIGLFGSIIVEVLRDFFGLHDSKQQKNERHQRYATLASLTENIVLGYLLFLAMFAMTNITLESDYFRNAFERNFFNGLFFFAVPVYVFAAINREKFDLDFSFWIIVGFVAGLSGSLGTLIGQAITIDIEIFRTSLREPLAYTLWSVVLFFSLVKLGVFPRSRIPHFITIIVVALLIHFLVTGFVRTNVPSRSLAVPFLVPLLYSMLFLGWAIGGSNASRQLASICKDAAAVFVVIFFVWIVFRVVIDEWPAAILYLDAFKKFVQWYIVYALLLPHLRPIERRS